jgi:glycosyltransferase involved in cell wall biosynthesis
MLLASMPLASCTLKRLLDSTHHIHIFSLEPDLLNSNDFLRNRANVFAHNLKMKMPFGVNIQRLKAGMLAIQMLQYGTWDTVFAVGQIGGFLGGLSARRSKCPFIYLNDEFTNAYSMSVWSKLEHWAVSYDRLLMIEPDGINGKRCEEARKQYRLPESVPFVAIPNSPTYEQPPQIDWKRRFNIPSDKKIVMHAGAIVDTVQIPEILSVLPFWPEDVVLLIHGRNKAEAYSYRKTISHLELPGRVFWSFDPLPENELHSLISFVDITLCLYRNTDINEELMGMASGKLMRSLVYGTPVICSYFESLNYIIDFGLGMQVKHPMEIAAAIKQILSDLNQYRTRCSSFAQKEGSFEDGWRRFQDQFYKTFGHDI